jgi:hypothetical protein
MVSLADATDYVKFAATGKIVSAAGLDYEIHFLSNGRAPLTQHCALATRADRAAQDSPSVARPVLPLTLRLFS